VTAWEQNALPQGGKNAGLLTAALAVEVTLDDASAELVARNTAALAAIETFASRVPDPPLIKLEPAESTAPAPAPARATRVRPEKANAETLTARGMKELFEGDVTEAIVDLRRATAIDVDHADAWRLLGLACERAGRSEEAIQAYRRYLELDRYSALAAAVERRFDALQ
jgi:Flp pilus assembly protein TadD